MICSFCTFEFSFQLLSADGSLGLADSVREEGALMLGGGVTTAAAAAGRGTNTGAVGRSDTALVGDPPGVAGAVTTASGLGDDAVEVVVLEGPEFLPGAIFRPWLVPRPSNNGRDYQSYIYVFESFVAPQPSFQMGKFSGYR